jgi:hypothetical protein
MAKRKVKTVEKKLGRYCVDGFAYIGNDRIEIEPRLSPRQKLRTHVHELYHIMTDDHTEAGSKRAEIYIADMLWVLGYRQLPKRFRD